MCPACFRPAGRASADLDCFFFSSRRRHTRLVSDWSSDVCSSDLNVTNSDMLEGISRTAAVAKQAGLPLTELMGLLGATAGATAQTGANIGNAIKSVTRSEERRGGEGGERRGGAGAEKKENSQRG